MTATWRTTVLSLAAVTVCCACVCMALREPAYPEHHPGIDDGGESNIVGAAPRSSKWAATRKAYLKGHPVCEACGTSIDLEVHHVEPFNVSPELELDPTNLVVLCRKDHLELGHRCSDGHTNWGKCGNPNVRADAAKLLMAKYGPK